MSHIVAHAHDCQVQDPLELPCLQEYCKDATQPLLMQFGSEQCALCPKATLDIDYAQKSFVFRWEYRDVLSSGSDIAEELEIVQLPAVLVFRSPTDYKVYQKLRGADIFAIIKENFKPRFLIDEEF
tara:strand:- start:72 stop:449 length:378 start_codon:yes stop_codon:yes gene_type:complete